MEIKQKRWMICSKGSGQRLTRYLFRIWLPYYKKGNHANHLPSLFPIRITHKMLYDLFICMAENRIWTWGYIGNREKLDWENSGELARVIFDSTDGKRFEWTEQMKNDLIHRIKLSVKMLGLPDTIEEMLEHFINYNTPQRLITSEKRIKRAIREREAKGR